MTKSEKLVIEINTDLENNPIFILDVVKNGQD
jgi:hypothetical protein